ncbi:MAG: biotin/lipoyl-containing protein [Candidatus Omnitrophota bacterium]|jgi:pyruvate/2-oxoglutarate dehydrogenase complex dihydrolipoamide acyltransferase (E2) component
MKKLVLPELGEGIEKATVSYWLFDEGAQVKEGQDVVEMVTDKATFNVPVTCSGVIKKILFREGEVVRVGEALAEIE